MLNISKQKFQVKVAATSKASASTMQKGKQSDGYTLEYQIKRRIPLESIQEIKLR